MFQKAKSHTKSVNLTLENTPNFDRYASNQIRRWAQVALDFPHYGKETYILFYELVKEDPIREMKKLLEYLNVVGDSDEAERLKCLERNIEGKFHRDNSKSNVEEASPFLRYPEIVKLYNSAIEEVDKDLFKLTNQHLPTHLYSHYEPQSILDPSDRFDLEKLFDPKAMRKRKKINP